MYVNILNYWTYMSTQGHLKTQVVILDLYGHIGTAQAIMQQTNTIYTQTIRKTHTTYNVTSQVER